jgi:EmrB/QacA subfamily drug resistance transporter
VAGMARFMDEHSGTRKTVDTPRRWQALVVLQLGVAMIIVDSTIVDVALGSIKADLGFSDSSLVWIVNAYLVTFGGFLLVSGRLGDVFGHRRLFLIGVSIFTIASLVCGIAHEQAPLVGARALQGLAGAIIYAVSLSLTMILFPDGPERTKAIAIAGVIGASGGSVGLLLGGTLTSLLGWHWIFLINIPIGVIVCILGVILLPDKDNHSTRGRIHLGGAVTVTLSCMLAMYATVEGNRAGWLSTQIVSPFAAAIISSLLFIYIQTRAVTPLIPPTVLRYKNFRIANVALALLMTSLSAWYFFVTLYLQLVLGWSALRVGLAFLPATLAMLAFSLTLSARLVTRFGTKGPIAIGLLLTTTGLMLFAQVPVHGQLSADVLPGMLILGLGGNLAASPLFLSAMAHVSPTDSGLASGVVNTVVTLGGAVGLAILVSIAESRTSGLLAAGNPLPIALHGGYQLALLFGAGISAATSVSLPLLRN